MGWDTVIGQSRVKQLLQRAIERRSVAHAYLFYGPEGVGKDALAIEFARTLQCREARGESCGVCPSCTRTNDLTHPDIRVIMPLPVGKGEEAGDDPLAKLSEEAVEQVRARLRAKGRDPYHEIDVPKATFIKINSVRDLKREAALSPVEGRYKIFLILGAEAMNAEASNSLLKTLEEPLPNAVLLLTTAFRERLSQTVLSRVQQIECSALTDEDVAAALRSRDEVSEEESAAIARMAEGSYRRAQRLIGTDVAGERAEVVQFLRLALGPQTLALASELERLAATDKGHVDDWLTVLASWLRDAMFLQSGVEVPQHRRDEPMDNFVKRFPQGRLPEALAAVEASIADLRKNVYLPLVLTTLAFSLRGLIASPTRTT
jgi:DNA polymerase-3 subunit delta'